MFIVTVESSAKAKRSMKRVAASKRNVAASKKPMGKTVRRLPRK